MLYGKKLRPATTVIVLIIAGSFVVNHFLLKPSNIISDFETELRKTADELNKKCPIMIDSTSRLDNAEVPARKTFQYNCTFITATKADFDSNEFKSSVLPDIIKDFKTSRKVKLFRDNNITVITNYHDKNGEFLIKYALTPKDYK